MTFILDYIKKQDDQIVEQIKEISFEIQERANQLVDEVKRKEKSGDSDHWFYSPDTQSLQHLINQVNDLKKEYQTRKRLEEHYEVALKVKA